MGISSLPEVNDEIRQLSPALRAALNEMETDMISFREFDTQAKTVLYERQDWPKYKAFCEQKMQTLILLQARVRNHLTGNTSDEARKINTLLAVLAGKAGTALSSGDTVRMGEVLLPREVGGKNAVEELIDQIRRQ